MTSNIRAIAPLPLKVPADPIWQLSVDQYHQMIESGILTDDDPVELLEGWLVTKMPKNPPHRLTTQLTREALSKLVPDGYYVEEQEPITTGESEPEPDVVVVRGVRRDFRDRHPAPQDVALVVEVSDATLQRDQTTKKQIYAQSSIPTYWIINLRERQIECYTQPTGPSQQPDYRQRDDFRAQERIEVLIGDRVIGYITVADILP